MDPSIRRDCWSPEEDKLLFTLAEKYANGWSAVARRMKGRTPPQCRTRWHYLTNNPSAAKASRDALKHRVPRKRGRPPKDKSISTSNSYEKVNEKVSEKGLLRKRGRGRPPKKQNVGGLFGVDRSESEKHNHEFLECTSDGEDVHYESEDESVDLDEEEDEGEDFVAVLHINKKAKRESCVHPNSLNGRQRFGNDGRTKWHAEDINDDNGNSPLNEEEEGFQSPRNPEKVSRLRLDVGDDGPLLTSRSDGLTHGFGSPPIFTPPWSLSKRKRTSMCGQISEYDDAQALSTPLAQRFGIGDMPGAPYASLTSPAILDLLRSPPSRLKYHNLLHNALDNDEGDDPIMASPHCQGMVTPAWARADVDRKHSFTPSVVRKLDVDQALTTITNTNTFTTTTTTIGNNAANMTNSNHSAFAVNAGINVKPGRFSIDSAESLSYHLSNRASSTPGFFMPTASTSRSYLEATLQHTVAGGIVPCVQIGGLDRESSELEQYVLPKASSGSVGAPSVAKLSRCAASKPKQSLKNEALNSSAIRMSLHALLEGS